LEFSESEELFTLTNKLLIKNENIKQYLSSKYADRKRMFLYKHFEECKGCEQKIFGTLFSCGLHFFCKTCKGVKCTICKIIVNKAVIGKKDNEEDDDGKVIYFIEVKPKKNVE